MRRVSSSALVLLAVGFSTVGAAAQTPGGGFKLGWASSNQAGGGYVQGVAAAGFLDLHLSRFLALQPEVAFVRKGASASATLYSVTPPQPPVVQTGRLEMRYGYLEAPLLLRLDVPVGESLRPFIAAGPYLGVNVGTWCSVSAPSEWGWTCTEVLAGAQPVRRIDGGVALAGGVRLRVSERYWLVFDARYETGGRSAFDSTPDTPSPIRNHSTILSVGVLRQHR